MVYGRECTAAEAALLCPDGDIAGMLEETDFEGADTLNSALWKCLLQTSGT